MIWSIVGVVGTILVVALIATIVTGKNRSSEHGPVVLRGYGITVHKDGTVFAVGKGNLGQVTELCAKTGRGTVSPSIAGIASSIATGVGHVHRAHFQVIIETKSLVTTKDRNGVISRSPKTLYVHEGDKGVSVQSRSRTLGDETRDLMQKRVNFCQTFNSLQPTMLTPEAGRESGG